MSDFFSSIPNLAAWLLVLEGFLCLAFLAYIARATSRRVPPQPWPELGQVIAAASRGDQEAVGKLIALLGSAERWNATELQQARFCLEIAKLIASGDKGSEGSGGEEVEGKGGNAEKGEQGDGDSANSRLTSRVAM